MRLERFANGCPGGVNLLIEQGLLDGDEKMEGQQTNEDVSLHTMFYPGAKSPSEHSGVAHQACALTPRAGS